MTSSTTPDFVHHLGSQPANIHTFPALKPGGAGMMKLTIPPNHMLTPHIHPNSAETTYCLSGSGEVGLVFPDVSSSEPVGAGFSKYNYQTSDVVMLPQGYLHYFANTGSENLELLLTFENNDFNILTMADMLQQLPDNIRGAALNSVPEAGHAPVVPF